MNLTHPCTMEIYREGSFTVKGIEHGENRCGIEQSVTYRYEVRLFAEHGSLNKRGFIIDNRAINTYWQLKWGGPAYKELPSCERMVAIALDDFRDLCALENVHIKGAEIRIYGGSYSAVTMRWGVCVPSMAHPAMNVVTPQPGMEPIPEQEPVWSHLLELTALP